MIKKEKKFMIAVIIVFLVFLVVGKYSQSQALTSASVVYATTVKDKATGEKVRFEVRRLKDNSFKITNTKTGQEYVSKPQTIAENYLRFSVGDKENPDATFDLKKGLAPWESPQLTLSESPKYQKTAQPSQVTTITAGSDQDLSQKSSVSDESTEDASQSSSSSNASDSSKKSTTTKSNSENSSSSSNAQEKLEQISLTDEDVKNVNFDFGQWLASSKYGKDSVIVNGQADDIDSMGATSTGFLVQDTVNGKMLTRLVGWTGDLSKSPNYYDYITGKDLDFNQFLKNRDTYKLALLGTDLTSSDGADYQAKSAFRVYTLKDKRASGIYENSKEYDELLSPTVPKDQQIGAMDYGYIYYYQNEVDQNKSSYQFLLGNDGQVYYVDDYWLKDAKKQARPSQYKLASKDVQDAYQKLLKKYSKTQASSSNSSTSSQASSTSSTSQSKDSSSKKSSASSSKSEESAVSSSQGIFPDSLLGTWEYKGDGKEANYTMTFKKDGTVIKVSNYEGQKPVTETAHVVAIEKINGDDSLYRYTDVDNEAVVTPGSYGGAGVKYASGFRLDNQGKLTTLLWQTAVNDDFDYGNPLSEKFQFTKIN